MGCNLIHLSPEVVEQRLRNKDAVLIDVREDFEHGAERIDGAVLHALSEFDPEALQDQYADKTVIFHCRSGKRSVDAAMQFFDDGEEGFHMQGGIEAWKASGRSVIKPASAPRIDVMRQVQITAGGLVLLGVVLGVFVNSWFLAISAFVGCGLMFAGLSGWCGMAKLLARMPWNK